MQTNFIQNTQLISNYKYVEEKFTKESVTFVITKNGDHVCPDCSSINVTPTYIKQRLIRGLPSGMLATNLSVRMHRIRCHDCNSFRMENIEFINSPYRRTTSCLERFVLDLRKHMCISSITKFYNLHWSTIKDIEKRYLKKKYKDIPLYKVKNIGIDEVYMGKSIGENGFLTIVRDLDSGAVLFVGKGKSGKTLDEFKVKLDSSGAVIESVGVDLAASFTAWIKKNIPSATIVYDHFHVVKLMNDKLTSLRRQTMNELEQKEKQSLKNRRWHYVRNQENLNEEAKVELKHCNDIFEDLGTAYWLKESLRNIYSICDTYDDAKIGFQRWCDLAIESNISQLKTMAKTISSKLEGILSFWKTGITSASMEGFNNKIGWLTRQAYGYQDEEYLILKIYDLPSLKIKQRLA